MLCLKYMGVGHDDRAKQILVPVAIAPNIADLISLKIRDLRGVSDCHHSASLDGHLFVVEQSVPGGSLLAKRAACKIIAEVLRIRQMKIITYLHPNSVSRALLGPKRVRRFQFDEQMGWSELHRETEIRLVNDESWTMPLAA